MSLLLIAAFCHEGSPSRRQTEATQKAVNTARYYYAQPDNEREVGPVSLTQLEALERTGQIKHDTPVILEGETTWRSFREIQTEEPSEVASSLIAHPDWKPPPLEPSREKSEENLTSIGSLLYPIIVMALVIVALVAAANWRKLSHEVVKSVAKTPERASASASTPMPKILLKPMPAVESRSVPTATPQPTVSAVATKKADGISEHLDFDDNHIPHGWTEWNPTIKDERIKNQHFEVEANGGAESWLSKPKSLPPEVSSLEISYSCKIEQVPWGMSQVQVVSKDEKIFLVAFGRKADFARRDANLEARLVIGNAEAPEFTNSFSAGDEKFRITAVFRDGSITCSGTKEGATETLFSQTIAVNGLATRDIQSVRLRMQAGWMDDVDIATTSSQEKLASANQQEVSKDSEVKDEKEKVRDFVRTYIIGDEAKSPDLLVSLFAQRVSPYFDYSDKDFSFVQETIAGTLSAWPIRRNELSGEILIEERIPGKEYQANFALNVYRESPARGEWTKGRVDRTLKITYEGDEPKISGLTSKGDLEKGSIDGTSPSSSPFPKVAGGLKYKTGSRKLISVFVKAVGFHVLIPTDIFPDTYTLSTKLEMGAALIRMDGQYNGTKISFSGHAENFEDVYKFQVRYAGFNSDNVLRYKAKGNNWFVVQTRYPAVSQGGETRRGVGSYMVGTSRGGRAYTMEVEYLEDDCPFSAETLEQMANSFCNK